MEDDYNLEELIKYTTLENFILSGYITESIRQEVKKLKECGNEEVRHFLDDINVDIDKQCLQRDKDHPIISPDYTINIKVPTRINIKIFGAFFLFSISSFKCYFMFIIMKRVTMIVYPIFF